MKIYYNNMIRNFFKNKKLKYKSFIVLIDAGHGGLIDGEYQTAGKRSPEWEDGSQYFEGVGNREIANKLAKLLTEEGIEYVFLHDEQKDNSLKSRVIKSKEIIEENADKHVFGVSIHSNGFSKESAHGWEVHLYENKSGKSSSKSISLSEIASQQFEELYPKEKNRGIKGTRLYMTRETSCPFILTENFFHTNKRECKQLLMTETGQDKIVKLHFNIIKAYIEKYL